VSSEPGQDLETEAIGVLFGDKNKGQDGAGHSENEVDGVWEPEWGEQSPPGPEEERAASDWGVDNSKVCTVCRYLYLV
jgi:hypothetical protein